MSRRKELTFDTKTTMELFVDRDEQRSAFRKEYERVCRNKGEIGVINYYGMGGIGKTTLLERITVELKNEDPKNVACVIIYSFEKDRSKLSFLFALSRIMMRYYNKSFPVFDIAYAKILSAQGKSIDEIGNCMKSKGSVASFAIGAIADFIGAGNVFEMAAEFVVDYIKGIIHRDRLSEMQNNALNMLENQVTSEGIERMIHKCFAVDAEMILNDTKKPFIIMLDKYEYLVNYLESGDLADGSEEWLCGNEGLVMYLPNTVWVVAGRKKLAWDTEILSSDNIYSVDSLSEEDSFSFFEAGNISNELFPGLYKLTSGIPVYMELCRKTYNEILLAGRTPLLDDFGKTTKDLAKRFYENMKNDQQIAMRLLCSLPVFWDDSLVKDVIKNENLELNYYAVVSSNLEWFKKQAIVQNEGGFYRIQYEPVRRIIKNDTKERYSDELTKIVNTTVGVLVDRLQEDDNQCINLAGLLCYIDENWGECSISIGLWFNITTLIEDEIKKVVESERIDKWLDVIIENMMKKNDLELSAVIYNMRICKAKLLSKRCKHREAIELFKELMDEYFNDNIDSLNNALSDLLCIDAICGLANEYSELEQLSMAQYYYDHLVEVCKSLTRDVEQFARHDILLNCIDFYIRIEMDDRAKGLIDQLRIEIDEFSEDLLEMYYDSTDYKLRLEYLNAQYLSHKKDEKCIIKYSELFERFRVNGLCIRESMYRDAFEKLIIYCFSNGEYNLAKEEYDRELEYENRTLGKESVFSIIVSIIFYKQCIYYGGEKKAKEYIGKLEQLFFELRNKLGAFSPEVRKTFDYLAIAYGRIGEHDKAMMLYNDYYDYFKEHFGENHSDAITIDMQRAYAYAEMGEIEKSYDELLRVYELICNTENGSESVYAILCRSYIVNICIALGRYDEAIKILENYAGTEMIDRERLIIKKVRQIRQKISSYESLYQILINKGENEKAERVKSFITHYEKNLRDELIYNKI